MSRIRIGCQTYTWQMSGEKYRGQMWHILDVVSRAGFKGLEPEVFMLGAYEQDPSLLANELEKHNIALAALCLVLDWLNPRETEEEKVKAEQPMDYLKHFPDAMLVLCQMPGRDRSNLHERQKNAIACINAVARRAMERGITSAFHPNSPPGSVFRTEEDYEILLDGLDADAVGFAPDAGHIANGGMDVVEVFKTYRPLIKHVHFKDISQTGEWTAMGAGVIDFPRLVSMLNETGFDGWIMVEEESAKGQLDPDSVTLANGKYVQDKLLPLIQ